MTIKTIDFEDFLSDKCDTHTNNDPAGFDKWLEELDGEQYMEFAQMFGEKCYLQGKEDVIKAFEPDIARMVEARNKLREFEITLPELKSQQND